MFNTEAGCYSYARSNYCINYRFSNATNVNSLGKQRPRHSDPSLCGVIFRVTKGTIERDDRTSPVHFDEFLSFFTFTLISSSLIRTDSLSLKPDMHGLICLLKFSGVLIYLTTLNLK